MKRRTFMQWLGALPFFPRVKSKWIAGSDTDKKYVEVLDELGSLPGVILDESKSKPDELPKDMLLNGTVWSSPQFVSHVVIVLFLDAKDGVVTFALLSQPYKVEPPPRGHNRTAMMVCHYDENTYGGKWSGIYSEDELRKKLSKWKRRPELELHLWNTEKQEREYFL